MDRQALIERLMATFLEELEEYVRAFDRDLLAFEKTEAESERRDLLTTLFRTAHSLKGAARVVEQKPIETAAHYLEEILAAARANPPMLDRGMLQVLFASADALKDAAWRLREKRNLDGSAVASLLPRLVQSTSSPSERAETAAAPVAPPEPRQQPAVIRESPVIAVAADKIGSLIDRGGEMLIARRRIAGHADAVMSLRGDVRSWQSEWRRQRNGGTAADHEHEARLKWFERELDRLGSVIEQDHRRLAQASAPLEAELLILRMIPFARATEGLDRAVRDLASDLGREADFIVEGGDVAIDRSILEALRAPLMQLVRNAVSHGIEPPAQRASKPVRGTVRVSAALRGSRVEIVVADDGRGLDLEAVRRRAGALGLEIPASDEEAAQLIFWPGLSTAPAITGTAGRGVGLDIVKSRVQAIHGTIDVDSIAGIQTTFTISVPLTLTSIRAILVNAGGHTFALETAGVARLFRMERSQIRRVEGREVVAAEDALLPLVNLGVLLGLKAPDVETEWVFAAVVQDGRNAAAFAVDELLSEQEIVVKNLGRRVGSVRKVAGTTLLPDGRLALILNAAELLEAVRDHSAAFRSLPKAPAAGTKRKRRLLVVDDSVTTRALQKSILESAGFEVIAASDGEEAWRLLRGELPDLVISDIEMPRMDGFELTETIRRSPRHRKLPVVLLTALSRDSDKARGLEAGADAYLIKSAFDQSTLLQTIAQLLG